MKRLERAGHVRRRRDSADERQVRVELTPKGLALRKEAQGFPSESGCAAGQRPEQIEALKQEVVRLRDALLARLGADPNGA